MRGDLDPAPRDASIVLSSDWLGQVLRSTYPDAVVESVVVVEAIESTAAKLRVVVTYGDVSDRPDTFCIKGYFNAEFAEFGTTGIHEARFYQRLAPQASALVPTVYYAGVNQESRHGVVVMEDLVATGATFFDQCSYLDPTTVRRSLSQLGRLHGQFWQDPIGTQEWLASKMTTYPGYIAGDEFDRLLAGPRCEGLSAELRDSRRLKAAMFALAERNASKPQTLVHADTHLGNIYRTEDGRIGFVDWQCYEFGHWSMDVAYHIAAALDPNVRSQNEGELLGHYLDELAANGGPAIDHREAWEDYRASLIYGYFLWAMTRRIDSSIVESLTQRLGKAVDAHDSCELLGV